MAALWWIAGILLVIAGILLLPVIASVYYHSEEGLLDCSVRILGFRIPIDPDKLMDKARGKNKTPTDDKPDKKATQKSTDKTEKFFSTARMMVDALQASGTPVKKFLHSLWFYQVHLEISAAGEDAYETALLSGKLSAAVYSVQAVLLHFLRIKKPDIRIYPDFQAEKTRLAFRCKVRIVPMFVLVMAVRIFWGIVRRQAGRKSEESPEALQPQKQPVAHSK